MQQKMRSGRVGADPASAANALLNMTAPFAAMEPTINAWLATQQALSRLWIDIGAEMASYTTSTLTLGMENARGGGHQPAEVVHEMLDAYSTMTRHVMSKGQAACTEIAATWARYPEAVAGKHVAAR